MRWRSCFFISSARTHLARSSDARMPCSFLCMARRAAAAMWRLVTGMVERTRVARRPAATIRFKWRFAASRFRTAQAAARFIAAVPTRALATAAVFLRARVAAAAMSAARSMRCSILALRAAAAARRKASAARLRDLHLSANLSLARRACEILAAARAWRSSGVRAAFDLRASRLMRCVGGSDSFSECTWMLITLGLPGGASQWAW
mmetsp:Transcript_11600/g.24881  ORF Transcript_11600/g.24881 Transcript_11600/m.24881 type:complete len:206 (+) Transcript_11600:325-942(+)